MQMNKSLKYYPYSIFVLILIFGLLFILNSLIEKYAKTKELNMEYIMLLKVTILIFLATFLNFRKEIRIKNFKLIKGIYNPIFGFITVEKQFSIDSITDVIIVQNSKKYFEIKALTIDDEMIIDTIANGQPAKIELKKIQQIIKTVSNTGLAQ